MAKTKIHGEYLDPSVISGQTQVTAVGADSMLIFDATDNALKKALLSDVIETVGSTPTFSQISATSDLTLDVGGDIKLDADGGDITCLDNGTAFVQIRNQNPHVAFQSNISNGDIKFIGSDGGTDVTALTLDMSDAGAATFNSSITVANTISISSSNASAFIQASDNVFQFGTSSDDPIIFFENNAEVMRIDTDGRFAINNSTTAGDSDIHDQVKLVCGGGVVVGSAAQSDNAFLQYTDAGGLTVLQGSGTYALRVFDDNSSVPRFNVMRSGNVGIGNNAPNSMHANANKLVVGDGGGDTGMSVFAGTNVGRYAFARAVGNNTDAYDGGMTYDGNRNLTFHTNAGSERMRILADGDVSISNDGQIPHASSKFHIKGSAFTMSDANGNAGGGVQIFNISKSAANTAVSVFKVQRDHGAHSGIAIVTKSNSGDSVAKIFAWAACYNSSSADIQTLASNVAGYTDFTASGTVSNDEFTFKLTNGDSNSRSFRVTVIYGGAATLGTPTLY